MMISNSDKTKLAPFRLAPQYVQRNWGTPDLRPWYDQVTDVSSGVDPIGEVWLTGDETIVESGAMAGNTLAQVFAEYPLAMLGSDAERMHGDSPLLLKVIFAKDKLSVQVHPDDRLARKYGEPRGKTECWYVLAADQSAVVAAGLKPGVTLQDVERGVADGTLEESLEILPISAGDMVFVDAGTVHAIWPGSVLLETQQNSDLTYRLYDYGRPRELHVAKALEAIRLETKVGKTPQLELPDRTVLVNRAYFCVEKIKVEGVRTGASMLDADQAGPGLAYLFAASGSGRISSTGSEYFESVDLPKYRIVALPAGSPEWKIEDLGGLDLIRITPRWPVTKVPLAE
jgi:mannose-6-phosphate isomerase